MGEWLVAESMRKCEVETGKPKLEETRTWKELEERREQMAKEEKLLMDEWKKSKRPLLDGGQGKSFGAADGQVVGKRKAKRQNRTVRQRR